jgi:hypothetical protein
LEEDMAKVDMLDKTREALEDKHSELETLKHRVGAAQEEFEKMREITSAQGMASEAQIEKMEKELNKIRATLGESVQLMEQREMNVNLEYVSTSDLSFFLIGICGWLTRGNQQIRATYLSLGGTPRGTPHRTRAHLENGGGFQNPYPRLVGVL